MDNIYKFNKYVKKFNNNNKIIYYDKMINYLKLIGGAMNTTDNSKIHFKKIIYDLIDKTYGYNKIQIRIPSEINYCQYELYKEIECELKGKNISLEYSEIDSVITFSIFTRPAILKNFTGSCWLITLVTLFINNNKNVSTDHNLLKLFIKHEQEQFFIEEFRSYISYIESLSSFISTKFKQNIKGNTTFIPWLEDDKITKYIEHEKRITASILQSYNGIIYFEHPDHLLANYIYVNLLSNYFNDNKFISLKTITTVHSIFTEKVKTMINKNLIGISIAIDNYSDSTHGHYTSCFKYGNDWYFFNNGNIKKIDNLETFLSEINNIATIVNLSIVKNIENQKKGNITDLYFFYEVSDFFESFTKSDINFNILKFLFRDENFEQIKTEFEKNKESNINKFISFFKENKFISKKGDDIMSNILLFLDYMYPNHENFVNMCISEFNFTFECRNTDILCCITNDNFKDKLTKIFEKIQVSPVMEKLSYLFQ